MSSTSNILTNNEPSGDDDATKTNDGEDPPPTTDSNTAPPKPANDATKSSSNWKENVAVAAAANNNTNGSNTQQQHHVPSTTVSKPKATSAAVSAASQEKRKRDDLTSPPQKRQLTGLNNDKTTANGNQKDKSPEGQQKTATAINQEEQDRQRADRFALVIRQQFDPSQQKAAAKEADDYEKDFVTSESLNILSQTRKDLNGIIKLMRVAEQDVVLQIQERKEQTRGYYYKKYKKSPFADYVDPDLGCQESLSSGPQQGDDSNGGKQKSNEIRNRTIQTVQETAILREATRLVRKQARELCKRRIRPNAASKSTASSKTTTAASKSANAASKSSAASK